MRILLIRTSALGDVIHTLPVLVALRSHLPAAQIAWLVEEAYLPLLQNHPDLDETIAVRLRAWRRRPFSASTWKEMRRLVADLERFHPDVVFDLMGNHKAGFLAALTMSDRRVGLARRFRREPSSAIWLSQSVRPHGRHSVDRMMSLLGALELPLQPVDFGAAKLAQALDLEAEPTPEASGIVLHPGAGWVNKQYPPDRWGRVAQLVHEQTGRATRVLSTEVERELARAVVAAGAGCATEIPAPDLRSLATELRRAELVMGGDTGPIHLARAFDRPVVCVMGPTDPERSGPYARPDQAVWHPLPCSFCERRYAETQKCMLELEPETVAARVVDLITLQQEKPTADASTSEGMD